MGNEKLTEKKAEKIKMEITYRTELIKLGVLFFSTAVGQRINFVFGIPAIVLLGLWLWLNHQKVVKLLNQLGDKDV